MTPSASGRPKNTFSGGVGGRGVVSGVGVSLSGWQILDPLTLDMTPRPLDPRHDTSTPLLILLLFFIFLFYS